MECSDAGNPTGGLQETDTKQYSKLGDRAITKSTKKEIRSLIILTIDSFFGITQTELVLSLKNPAVPTSHPGSHYLHTSAFSHLRLH